MWNKIKNWLAVVLAGITAFLFALLRIKSKKLKETTEELETAERNIETIREVHKVEEKLQEVSEIVEKETEEKIQEVKQETAEKISEVSGSETVSGADYNRLIGAWNNEEKQE